MAQPGFIFGGNTGMSYDQIQKQRDIANELLRANMSTPQNVGEGLSAIGRALAAKAIDKRTTRADDANRAASEERRASAIGSIFGGGGSASPAPFSPAPLSPAAPPSPAASVADDTMSALGKTPMRPFRDAIASIESAGSGDYAAVGPTNPRLGRALGRYQIMEANIGPWSREVLGREVTPDEFLANPQLQDAIFDGKFGGYVEQFGPEGAAQAWFAGPGGVGKMDRQDVLGTSVADYTQKFSAALGGSAPATPAPTGGVDPANIKLIADLLADPYTPPGEKVMLEQAMAMALQGMDPMRQMEMERARLELDQMRNPQTPEQLTERQALAAAGNLQPGTPEYQAYMLTGEMPGRADNPASVQEYQFYAEQAKARGETPMPYEKFMTLEAAAGNPAAGNFTQPVTPGQEQIDKAYAPEYVQWTQGGGADMANQIATVEGIADRLESGSENLTGPGVGSQPDWLGAFTTPNAVAAREDVESVVQRNLRVLLGAQFTQAEGDRLIARAYNPRLPEAENAVRLRRLAKGMRAAADARAAQAEYYQANGTLVGWEGKVWTPADFERVIEDGEATPTAPDADGWQTINGVKVRVKQ